MTREEAVEWVCNTFDEDFPLSDGDKAESIEALVNRVYNRFESRTCENCKHSVAEDYKEDEDVYSCRNDETNLPIEQVFTKDFSCNKWETKDEE